MIAEILPHALRLWGLEGAQVALAAQRENTVFKVEAKGRIYALRVHRRNYRSDDELRSELMWMEELASRGLTVPHVIPSLNRQFMEVVGGLQVDVLSWVPGEALGQRGVPLRLRDRTATFRRFGEELARLHIMSDAWKKPANFMRKPWDRDGLLGEQPQWGRFWENPALTPRDAQLLSDFRHKARAILNAQARLDDGLIHADLVPENVLLHGDQVIFIDFDDGGPGFRLYDFATALIRHQHEEDYAQLEAAFLQGYRSLRAIDTELLPLFFALKACAYVGWTMERINEPANADKNDLFIRNALTSVKRSGV